MSLHKLTAGDGYTYLTRQVAAADTTERGSASLGEYYSAKGESPGEWLGAGLSGLAVTASPVSAGAVVSEEQMLALFGEGRHPDATAIEERLIGEGAHPSEALAQTRLGNPFKVYEGSSSYRQAVAQRFVEHNTTQGLSGSTPIPEAERARIRTDVAQEMFVAEFGRAPADERELSGFVARGSRQATTAVAGYDLTFSPVKSVSTLWAVAPREIGEEIEAAHTAAVADAVSWLETHAAFTRLGTDGVRQVDTTGLIGASFTHRDSRAGDPDLHTHVAVSNKVQTANGRWLALDGRVLHKAAVAASERYNTRLEAHLITRLGVDFAERAQMDASKRAVREVVGVEAGLNEAWSTRRARIEVRRAELAGEFQERHGRAPSAVEALALAQQATLETREAKHEPRSHAEQRAQWRTEAQAVLGGREALTRMIADAVPGLPPAVLTEAVTVDGAWVQATAAAVVATVSAARATWQPDHIRAQAERAARTAGIRLPDLDRAVDAVTDTALGQGQSVRLSAPDRMGGVVEPAVLRRADGQSVYTVARTQLFTSQVVMGAEARLLTAARRSDGRVVSGAAVDMALLESVANGRELNPGQAGLVRDLATSGVRVQVALAPAGTGKTTAMRVLARAWAEEGGTVIGLAPTAAAASVLAEDIEAPTDTLDKLVHAITALGDPGNADTGVRVPDWVTGIDHTTLVVVDEAAMVGTPNLDTAVNWVLSRGGSVRLVGDDQQLASVAAGGVIRDIAESVGAATLTHVVRFHDPAEGSASLAIREGNPDGLGFYIDHDRVHVGDPATSVEQAYTAWAADTATGADSVMLAPTRDMVAALNDRARADRVTATGGPVGAQVALRGGQAASAGDMITTRRNDRRLVLTHTDWVRNGDRWQITQVHPDRSLTVRHLATRRVITLPADYVAAHVDLGYARTIHSAQGLTADTAHTVITGAEARQVLYVGLTRGRRGNHLYVAAAGDGDPHARITPDVVDPPTAVDVLTRIVAHDGAQASATTTAADLADPRLRLHTTAGAYDDAVGVAAENLTPPEVLARIDTAADEVRPGLREAPAWATLRAHLAVLYLHGRDPVAALTGAAQGRELDTADDAAAVLDWRLDHSGHHSTGAGPLPWLTAIPPAANEHPEWGPYLRARADAVTATTTELAAQTRAMTPTTAQVWARALVGESPELLVDLVVWRAGTGVPDTDRRPTGPDAFTVARRRHQDDLTASVTAVLGAPDAAVTRWTPLARTLEPRLLTDPYFPVLAEQLSVADRAGLDITALTVVAARQRALPDELPAAALWWRLSRDLGSSVLQTATSTGAGAMGSTWATAVTAALGPALAQRVTADAAWPALVTAIDTAVHHGWDPEQVLRTAHELLRAAAGEDTPPLRVSEMTTALAWRVEALGLSGLDTHRYPDDHAEEPPGEHLIAESDMTDPDRDATTTTLTTVAEAGFAETTTDEDTVLEFGVDEFGVAEDTLVGPVLPEWVPDEVTELWEWGWDWDWELLVSLPYADLDPHTRVAQISADADAAHAQVDAQVRAMAAGTSTHLQATDPLVMATRARADELHPWVLADADARQDWVDAELEVDTAQTWVAQAREQLADAHTHDTPAGETVELPAADLHTYASALGVGVDQARTHWLQAPEVTVLNARLGVAEDVLAHARARAADRRADWNTARTAVLTAAGPGGVVTSVDVERMRGLAHDLDVEVLSGYRATAGVLDGALLRAESHAARAHADTHTPTITPALSEGGPQLGPDTGATATVVRALPRAVSEVTALTRPVLPSWQVHLGARPTAPAEAIQWDSVVALVGAYRATYRITSTDPTNPLGDVPAADPTQIGAHRALTRAWKDTTMTPTGNPRRPADEDTPVSALAARLAAVARRLTHTTDRVDRADRVDVVRQDGLTDDRGLGHDTAYTTRYGTGRGDGMGY